MECAASKIGEIMVKDFENEIFNPQKLLHTQILNAIGKPKKHSKPT